MKKKQRVIAGATLAAGLVAGGGAGVIIGASSGSAGAAPVVAVTEPPTTAGSSDPSGTTPAPPTPDAPKPAADAPKPTADREQRVRDLLQPLVDDGTITAAQLDAIVAKLATAEPGGKDGGRPGGTGRPGGLGGIGGLGRILDAGVDTVATTLGISADDVRAALRDGTTLKALAEAHGKTAQDVIDALVAATKTQLDAKVADGSMTQAEADTALAAATIGIPALVNNGIPARFPGRPDGGHRGDKPAPSTDAPSPAPSATPSSTPSSTPSTTTG